MIINTTDPFIFGLYCCGNDRQRGIAFLSERGLRPAGVGPQADHSDHTLLKQCAEYSETFMTEDRVHFSHPKSVRVL